MKFPTYKNHANEEVLSAYSWPGAYPVFYYTEDGTCLCAECAQADIDEDEDEIVGFEANWENPTLYCDGCGERIESAYAEEEE